MKKREKILFIILAIISVVTLIIVGTYMYFFQKFINSIKAPGEIILPEVISNRIHLECLNLKADEFRNCEDNLNNLEISAQNSDKLKTDCLANKENVRNFLINNNDANILKGKQLIYPTHSSEDILRGKGTITANTTTTPDLGFSVQILLEWEAVKQADENICQKINLYEGVLGVYSNDKSIIDNCANFTQMVNFVSNVYKQDSVCQNLCENADKIFNSADECAISCRAVKANNVNDCDLISGSIEKTTCKAIVSFNPALCVDIAPSQTYEEGKLVEENMTPICQRTVYMYNAVKQNNENLINEAYKIKKFEGSGDLEYLDKLYFKKDASDNGFTEGYVNYCNLRYNL